LNAYSRDGEYLSGELRSGERPSGKQIATHLESVFAGLSAGAERCYLCAGGLRHCYAQLSKAFEQLTGGS